MLVAFIHKQIVVLELCGDRGQRIQYTQLCLQVIMCIGM